MTGTTSRWHDRAAGALLGAAVGDALGAGYEFGSAPLGPEGPRMIGGGLGDFAPGEWTDDTAMTWCVAEVAATGADLRSEAALTAIARNFRAWLDSGPPDVGVQTRAVLRDAGPEPTPARLAEATARHHERSGGRSAGNGSLMRTAPVALAHLGDRPAIAEAAHAVSALTHFDPVAGQACALWCLAIDHAVRHAEFDLRGGLELLESGARTYWAGVIDAAEEGPPERFTANGWVVEAFQAAWSSIHHTPVPGGDPGGHLPAALATAVGIGMDTDTVAAIAGALLGARWGAAAVPGEWRRICHGYPGLTGDELVTYASDTDPSGSGSPT
ncbi:ADP-ribosylglycohydrolase family protein [Dietzia sp. 179-F 9C3 NHS]|uniref:ADP-ribosylglycohydrolase family protein n=1 Tax=Dietzia sp. 179-F 9C3 NHS TaxID=3374295 RepID=UPI003878FDAB